MKFSKIMPANQKALAAGESLSEHGITVTKLPNGDEKWSVAFMYHGERVKRVIGRTSENWNRTLVAEKMAQIKANIRDGTSDLPKGRKTQLRFAELARWYLEEMEATGGKNVVRKRFQLMERLVPHLGNQIVVSMTEEHVGRYTKALLDDGLGPATINRDLATLHHVLSTAERRRKVRGKPCHVTKLAEPEGRTITLSPADTDALLCAAAKDSNPHLWLFVQFGLATGMRSAEIVSARFEHIDWEHRRLFLPKAKGGGRLQPLTRSLVELLRAEREGRSDPAGWIFPSATSKSGHATNFNTPFKRAVKAAKLCTMRVTPHVMRHTAATRMVASGAPLPAVQGVTGHKTLAMLVRYTHLANANIDSAIAVLDREAA